MDNAKVLVVSGHVRRNENGLSVLCNRTTSEPTVDLKMEIFLGAFMAFSPMNSKAMSIA